MEKILITGTGRCGTTFLIKIFTFLNFDTGYTRNNYQKYIFPKCNSGMEKKLYTEKNYILKNPEYIKNIENIIQDKSIIIKTIILPVRNLREAAISRVKLGQSEGGLLNAKDELSQIQYYKDILSNYVYIMTKYDINTIFIDFDKMINDKLYLFNKLKNILNEKFINYETFSEAYDDAASTSRPNPKEKII